MKRLLVTTTAFALVALTGGVWIGLVEGLTESGSRNLALVLVGAAFSLAFLWLLVVRLRRLLADPDRLWLEVLLLGVNLTVLILVFAWVHHQIGIVDASGPIARPTRDFGSALYFSIVTLTTLGYGDFYPMGVGRAIAAMQGLVGYTILGILVSTGFQVLRPSDGKSAAERARERSRENEPDAARGP